MEEEEEFTLIFHHHHSKQPILLLLSIQDGEGEFMAMHHHKTIVCNTITKY